uniref:Uncharacterized protein n=1 Tax=Panagrolaimus superbus TaxID=310955 RepID=A0A914YMS5_9BILA
MAGAARSAPGTAEADLVLHPTAVIIDGDEADLVGARRCGELQALLRRDHGALVLDGLFTAAGHGMHFGQRDVEGAGVFHPQAIASAGPAQRSRCVVGDALQALRPVNSFRRERNATCR